MNYPLINSNEVKIIKKMKSINLELLSKNLQKIYAEAEDKDIIMVLYKVLPYLNDINAFAKKSFENSYSKSIPLTWEDIIEISEFKGSVSELKDKFIKLSINNHKAITIFSTGSGHSICLNPKIYSLSENLNENDYLNMIFK